MGGVEELLQSELRCYLPHCSQHTCRTQTHNSNRMVHSNTCASVNLIQPYINEYFLFHFENERQGTEKLQTMFVCG